MTLEAQSRLVRVRTLATEMLIAADAMDTARVLEIADEQDLIIASIRLDWRAEQELRGPGEDGIEAPAGQHP